ncbi:hypothetical protein HMPREF9333_00837 [Johnsonella ignava ATCC 51276]|mgnify:FL=1|jgi:sporulation protein ytfJ|uniref:Sporulation protein YtfJ n=1 Tax=Johnsonella ignava ATCC 51276 TaxID=679200 RepID=G5GGZ7_9FIRM|nr:GerW family sporulation protein [Johnsonella ignava]EHI56055.1 hypothetical protein HMPREF9333_00837 [Johnsonella ignava ATCC 51276]
MDEKLISSISSLFDGMELFINTKTVVGEPIKIDDTIILPLVDVTCGMAAGGFEKNAQYSGGGGMNAKMSPAAILIIQNGRSRLVNVRNQDALSKIIDLVPEFVNKFKSNKDIDEEAVKRAKAAVKYEFDKAGLESGETES